MSRRKISVATSLTRASSGPASPSSALSGDQPVGLNLITYLVPGLPLDLFVTYQRLFEEALQCESYLSVEARWSAPPKGHEEVFTTNKVDVAFISSMGYVRLSDAGVNVELLGVAPLYDHGVVKDQPYYYSDVIMLKERAPHYKVLDDLRGHIWATNDPESISGHIAMLSELKKFGYNASFFGDIQQAGSQRASIDMVLNSVVDASAIDSNVLQLFQEEKPEYKDRFHILTSWGPWPIQPIVVNSRLPAEVKSKLATALLGAMVHPVYGPKFRKFCIKGFKRVDSQLYDRAREVMEAAKGEDLFPAYY